MCGDAHNLEKCMSSLWMQIKAGVGERYHLQHLYPKLFPNDRNADTIPHLTSKLLTVTRDMPYMLPEEEPWPQSRWAWCLIASCEWPVCCGSLVRIGTLQTPNRELEEHMAPLRERERVGVRNQGLKGRATKR